MNISMKAKKLFYASFPLLVVAFAGLFKVFGYKDIAILLVLLTIAMLYLFWIFHVLDEGGEK